MKPPLEAWDVISRFDLDIIWNGGEVVLDGDGFPVRDGNGDLVFDTLDANALFRLMQGWRHIEPGFTHLVEMMFETLGRRAERDEKIEALDDRIAEASRGAPVGFTDFAAVAEKESLLAAQRADTYMAAAFGGSIMVVLDQLLARYRVALRLDPKVPRDEKVGALIGGRSFGAVVWAAANNHRHYDEWQKFTKEQAERNPSIQVLRDALGKRVDGMDTIPFDVGAVLVGDLAPGRTFMDLSTRLFDYAKALQKDAAARRG